MEIAGRTALVTGGAHRVGGAVTLALARAGANVIVNYLTSEVEADSTVEAARDLGAEAVSFRADVSDPDQVAEMVEFAGDRFGGVDILVNSASAFATDPFPPTDFATWHRTFDVVVHGAYYCSSIVAPGMLERSDGVILNIVDLSAWQPWPDRGAHSVAKAASLALTRQLAVELAPTVRANAVALGPTIPPVHFSPEQVERLRSRTLLGRWTGGDEVGRAVRYLVESETVTGECLTVDAGEQYGHVRERFE
ncbi:MAG TPA: SDR family oxidoreductase [Acidimicrobiales bacterium]|nr:SDR family oxidoreductase [Acidimicrobiales bacterium]